MNRLNALILGLTLGILLIVPAVSQADKIIGIDLGLGTELSDGVYCEINNVRLFAQNDQDCEKAGGAVTHTVKTEILTVDDSTE